jgi:uncharacterized protein
LKRIISEPLSYEDFERLDAFLLLRVDDLVEEITEAGGDPGIVDMAELDGFLTALISGPNVIAPSKWLPAMWGAAAAPAWMTEDDYRQVLDLLLRYNNMIASALLEDPESFEPVFAEYDSDEPGETEVTLDEWCRGYLRGVELDPDAWRACEAEIAEFLQPIKTWGTDEGSSLLSTMTDAEREAAPDKITHSVRALYTFWRERSAAGFAPTIVRASPKIGRNEPCPCGSGKKYKHCCLQ